MSDAKTVIRFPGKSELPDCPVGVERRLGFCNHDKIRLVEHDRAVVCANCGATIDPFDYLLKGAYAVRHAWQLHAQVVAKTSELQRAVDDLQKERKRLGAMVKRLAAKTAGDVIDVRKPL